MSRDEASTRFLDGMRVATEHMRHLQRASVERALQVREAIGLGKVVHGLKVEVGEGGALTVSPGLALDAYGRPVVVEAPVPVGVDGARALLVAVYDLRSSLLVNGVPTVLANGARIEARTAPPPYDDGAVAFAEVARDDSGVRVLQKGEWYLPPLGHGHTGAFFTDAAGRWRYDGAPVGGAAPQFDSGFVPVAPGASVRLTHGLKSTELAVELTARSEGGRITNRGIGADFWFELPGEDEIVLACAGTAPSLELRARAWLLAASGPAAARPVADAGADRAVDPGESFGLDGSGSRALGGRRLVRFIWTQLT